MRQPCLVLFVMILAMGGGTSASRGDSVLPQNQVARLGLTRAWYAQVGAQRVNGGIAHISYELGMLLVQSKSSMISALDAETGRMRWSFQAGPENHLSTEPAANEKYVAVVNGSVLYVIDRSNGHLLWQRPLGGSPGAGPGVSPTHVFVPMVTGMIEGYDLEKGEKETSWNYHSAGRVLAPLLTTNQTVSWTTEKGYYYAADASAKGIMYRLETRDAIHARPAFWMPHLFACSSDGFVYAIHERNGKIDWKFTVGEAIYQSPVAVENKVFVIPEFNGMYCLDGMTGKQSWYSPRVAQFISMSPTRIYACDVLGRLVVLDGQTGAMLGGLPLSGFSIKLVNDASDRIFMATENCVVQCLREIDLKSPVLHTSPQADKPEVPKPSTAKPKAIAKEASSAEPADRSMDDKESGDKESAEGESEPATDADAGANPFN